jgi:hypothetical protein
MWSPSRKVKMAILKSVFVDLQQILKKKFEQKIRHFFNMFGTFNLTNSKSLIRTQNFLKSNNSKILLLQKLPGL